MSSTGYGADTWCTTSLRTGRLARGSQVVLQALYRRLITPRGMLRGGDEEDVYGLDLAGLVGSLGTEQALVALPSMVRAECLKDDRVSDVAVTVVRAEDSTALVALTVAIDVTLDDESEPQHLTLAVTDTTVEILGGIGS